MDFITLSTSPISFKYLKYLYMNHRTLIHSTAGIIASIKLPPSDPVMATTEYKDLRNSAVNDEKNTYAAVIVACFQ